MNTENNVIIVSAIWSNLGDVMYVKNLYEILNKNTKVIFYFVKELPNTNVIIKYIEQNFDDYQICDDLNNLLDYGNLDKFKNASIILNTMPKDDEVLKILQKKQIIGKQKSSPKFYKLLDYMSDKQKTSSNSIITGFGDKTKGIFISPQPQKMIMEFFDDYDVYTCYMHEYPFINEFMKFISAQPVSAPKGRLLVVQGDMHKEKFASLEMVDEIKNVGKVYQYDKNLRVVCEQFSFDNSKELFYYSNKITACSGNQSLSLCISYKKIFMIEWREKLESSLTYFYQFIKEQKYDKLIPLYKNLVHQIHKKEPIEITDEIISLNYKLCELVANRFSLGENLASLFKFQKKQITGGYYTKESQSVVYGFYLSIVTIIIIVFLLVFNNIFDTITSSRIFKNLRKYIRKKSIYLY